MLRKIGIIGCLLLSVWFMCPIVSGILHIGMLYPTALLLLLGAVLWQWSKIKLLFHSKYKIGVRIIACLCIIGILALVIPVGYMIAAIQNQAPEEDVTVIVLGCQVNGTIPSLMLRNRCDAALQFLQENPTAMCIASGGKGNNETISEARAIFNYLTEHGIAAQRILLEEQSATTSENLVNSALIISQNNLPAQVVIATDSFHQLRASLFAKQNNLTAYSAPCDTYIYLAPSYWAREILAVYKALLLGY